MHRVSMSVISAILIVRSQHTNHGLFIIRRSSAEFVLDVVHVRLECHIHRV